MDHLKRGCLLATIHPNLSWVTYLLNLDETRQRRTRQDARTGVAGWGGVSRGEGLSYHLKAQAQHAVRGFTSPMTIFPTETQNVDLSDKTKDQLLY